MSEIRAESPMRKPMDTEPAIWARVAVGIGCVAALAAGCSATPEEVESHAGQVTYDHDAFVDAAMCAAEKEQPIDGAGMVWVTAAMQDGIIRYRNGKTVDCGPGGGLPPDDDWNTKGGENTDAAAWIDDWEKHVKKAYPATTFTELSNEEIKAGALEDITAKPDETTILLLNLDGDNKPTRPWLPLSRTVKYEQIFPVVGQDASGNPLVFGVSIHEDGTKPTNQPPWPISESAHGGELVDGNPELEATVVHFNSGEPFK